MGNLKVNTQTNEVLNEAGEVVGTLVKDAEQNPNVVVKDAQVAVQYVKSQGGLLKSLNTRTLEKLLAYGAALVAATNGFAQLSMPTTVRGLLMAASAVVIGSQHVSDINSPTKTG